MPEFDLRSYGKSEARRLLHQQASGHHRLDLFGALRSIERGDFAIYEGQQYLATTLGTK